MPNESLLSDCEMVFDSDGTLARYGGSSELLLDMIGFYVEDAPKLLNQLRSAAAAGDAEKVRTTAHALKGLIAGCGGKRAAAAAQRIEHLGADGNLSEIDLQIDALATQMELLRDVATAYRP
jgi:HPt (histidine-containing phosphotransfer) domain-containing protein